PARLPSTGLLFSLRDRIFLITDPIAETSRIQAPFPAGEMQGQQIGTRRHAGTTVDDGTFPFRNEGKIPPQFLPGFPPLPFRQIVFPKPVYCAGDRSEEHTSELQSRENLVCRLLLEEQR